MEGSHANKPASDNKTRSKCFTSEDRSRKDERSADDASESPDPSIVYASDDPRGGGRLSYSDNRESEVYPPSASPHRQATNDDKSNNSHSAAGGEAKVPSDSNMAISSKINEVCPSPTTLIFFYKNVLVNAEPQRS